MLDNRRPANVADLAALTTSYLREIARRVRDGNTSDWRQYWNVDYRNRPTEPKPEDACRDALLSDLQSRLTRLQVDAQPEGRYADDKRSDIRVSHGECNVPVEIKKCSHRDLWSAIRTQLIARYTRDPGAGGHGIYLVFWFGAGAMPAAGAGSASEECHRARRAPARRAVRGRGASRFNLYRRRFEAGNLSAVSHGPLSPPPAMDTGADSDDLKPPRGVRSKASR